MLTIPSNLPPELQKFRYLTEKEVFALTGFRPQTLANHRSRGVGLPYIKVGRSIRYALRDVLAFMEAHRIQREG